MTDTTDSPDLTENILVIEDEPDLREGLKHNLELDGYHVQTAATGPEGLKMATQNGHSLILLDLMLPERARSPDAGDHHLCQGPGPREGGRTGAGCR
jgi:CheY-like chemotaxis protein